MKSNEDYAPFLAALLVGDHAQSQAIFESWLAEDVDLRVLYEERVQPALYAIGDLWEQGQVSVATQHLASAITEGLLNMVYPRLFKRVRNGKSVIVACAANEYHHLGGKMVADLFVENGWRSDFLGVSTTLQALLSLVRDKRPDAVVLSFAIQFNLEELVRSVETLRAAHPQLPILVGGQGFLWGGKERIAEITDVYCLASLQDLQLWIDSHA